MTTCIENIDIGGPAMIRAASKNHAFVNVVVDVEDYSTRCWPSWRRMTARHPMAFRQWLAQKAYARTAAYDAAVSNWMADALQLEAPAPRLCG